MKSFTNQQVLLENLPKEVREHLQQILSESNLPDNETSFGKLIEAWLIKRALFDRITEHGEFKKTNIFKRNNKNGCLAITMSGSIIALGPIIDNFRDVTYTSLGMRTTVPPIVKEKKGVLGEDLKLNESLSLIDSQIKYTSPIIDIGIAKHSDDLNDEIKVIEETNILLQDNFLKVNEYTFKANYFDYELVNRNDLFNKWILLEWFELGGLDKHIFHARAKILWLELFSNLFKELSVNAKFKSKKEKLFIEFTNEKFTKYIDDYKWYKSQEKDFDIGLMKALEDIPKFKNFWEFVDNFVHEMEKDK